MVALFGYCVKGGDCVARTQPESVPPRDMQGYAEVRVALMLLSKMQLVTLGSTICQVPKQQTRHRVDPRTTSPYQHLTNRKRST